MYSIVCFNKEKFIYPIIEEKGVKVFSCYKFSNHNWIYRIIKLLAIIFSKIHLDGLFYGGWYKRLKNHEDIVFLDEVGISSNIYSIINKHKDNSYVYLWNIFEKVSYKENLCKIKCKIYSFDKDDCQKYSFVYKHSIIPEFSNLSNNDLVYDLCFIGLDKGRRSKVGKVIESGLFKNPLIKIYDEKIIKKSYSLDYLSYIDYVKKSKFILEILQDNQSGETLRLFESILLHKKMLTNNSNIKKLDYYNKKDFFVIEDFENIDTKKIEEFIASDYEVIDKSFYEDYLPQNWLNYLKR